ncbi:MAG: hypothetical protein GX647_05210 [Clostridiales bacterium]|nr:hypothetical protein [Clostridiales bacterium]
MKKGFKIAIIAVVAVLAVSLAAGLILDKISHDNWETYLDELERSPEDITGTWKRFVQIDPEDGERFWGNYIAEMNADGTYTATDKDTGELAERGTYTYRNGILALTTGDGTVSFELKSNTHSDIYLGDFTYSFEDGTTAKVLEMWSRD